ncbi:hypothetical protein EDC01DRAFT_743072 [Geopyxis carbonaria]|nr:hypothetical protein EDC01DRAFT_743072 [Geopyxis carbonaria]
MASGSDVGPCRLEWQNRGFCFWVRAASRTRTSSAPSALRLLLQLLQLSPAPSSSMLHLRQEEVTTFIISSIGPISSATVTTVTEVRDVDLLGWDPDKSVFLYNSQLTPESGSVTVRLSVWTSGTSYSLDSAYVFNDTAADPPTMTTVNRVSTRDAFYSFSPSLLGNALVLSVATEPKPTTEVTPSPTDAIATDTNPATESRPAASTGFAIAEPGRYSCERDAAGSLACRTVADKSTAGPIAAAGVMGGLFCLALVALVFLFMRQRRRGKHPSPPAAAANADHADGADNADGASHSTLAGTTNSYGGVGKVDGEGGAGGPLVARDVDA